MSKIISRPSTDDYRKNYDMIFSKNDPYKYLYVKLTKILKNLVLKKAFYG